jgi:gliotoxin/aspirochlorine biosynthesis aminotransferase
MFSWPSSLACSTLSTILNHPTFFKSFITTNCKRLVEQYNFCTSFLKNHSIPYIHSNAGFYLWADLSAFSDRLPGANPLEKERELNLRLMDGGLHLATSEAFWGEDCGWFRITFAVPRKVLELGLNRYCPPGRADGRMVEAIGAKEGLQNGFARVELPN